jgi:D-lactate dehydrogenase
LKPKAILINTGRGALIDTKAIIRVLKTGQLGGLAIGNSNFTKFLDVYEQEEKMFFKDVSTEILTDDVLARLLTFNNVIVTGHQVAINLLYKLGFFHK